MPVCTKCGAWLLRAVTMDGEVVHLEPQGGGTSMIMGYTRAGTTITREVRAGSGTHVAHRTVCTAARGVVR